MRTVGWVNMPLLIDPKGGAYARCGGRG